MAKKFNVTIQCMAVYTATIEVDDDASYEEALEEARMNLSEIPLGELEYVQDSDILDEENCYFEDDENDDDFSEKDCGDNSKQNTNCTDEYEDNFVSVWDYFDNRMKMLGYDISVKDFGTLAEEREMFGKPMSSLGTTASKKDKHCPVIKLYVPSDYSSMSISVHDRNGDFIADGREVFRCRIKTIDEKTMEDVINIIQEKFGSYSSDNYMPRDLEIERIEK